MQRDENKIDAFIQCFGSRVFLQNLDEKTNKLAEQTFGQIWAERTDFSGADLKLTSVFGETKSGSVSRRKEKQNRFDKETTGEKCPKCAEGRLLLITACDDSRWYGCSAFPNCRFTKSYLPHTFKAEL